MMIKLSVACLVAALAFGGCAYVADPSTENDTPTGLVINEVLTANNTGIMDASGNREAWFELFNAGDSAVDLKDYTISDDSDKPFKWQSGSYTVGPGEYCLVFASGNDIAVLPDSQPPYVICSILTESWSDAQQAGIVKGTSYAGPYEFPGTIEKTENGVTAISGTLFLGDVLESIGWEGQSIIEMSVKNPGLIDFTPYNQIVMKGYLEAGKKLTIGITQPNWREQAAQERYFSGPRIEIVGTGEKNGEYRISLNDEAYNGVIKSTSFGGLSFENRAVGDTVRFTFNSITLVNTGNCLHTGFKLDKSKACTISLYHGEKQVEKVAVPALKGDQSWCRRSSNGSHFGYCDKPTPAEENRGGAISVVTPSTTIVTHGGFYSRPVSVEISGPANTTIRYTTNGSVPVATSRVYTDPIVISSNTTIRSAAFRSGELASDVSTQSYFIGEKCDMPIISMIVDSMGLFNLDTGIYMPGPHASATYPFYGGNFWDKNLQIPAHVQFYEPGGKLAFSQGIGLKIHGGWSRGADKKPFAFAFDDQFGTEGLSYPIFPDHPELTYFKSLILRQGGDHASDVIFWDALHGCLIEGRDVDYQKVRPVILYINGMYWGIYNIREKLSRQHYAINHGIDPENISLVEDGGNVLSGSADSYIRMLDYMAGNSLADSVVYEYVKTQMDVYNYIDYMATQIYITNTDWPANNCKWWRSNLSGGKWRWSLYDTDMGEFSSESPDFDMMAFVTNAVGSEYPNGAQFTFIFRKLLGNKRFKEDFINRSATLLATNFSPANYRREFERLKGLYGNETVRDFARWGNDVDYRDYVLKDMIKFGDTRPGYLRENLRSHFSLGFVVTLSLRSNSGTLHINGMDVRSKDFAGEYFTGCPVTVELRNAPGFLQWSDGVQGSTRVVSLLSDTAITAIFK